MRREPLPYKSLWEIDAYPKVGTVQIFCDGGLAGPKNPSPEGGTWAYLIRIRQLASWELVGAGAGRISPADYGLTSVSNNISELVAMVEGLRAAEFAVPDNPKQVLSDSWITLQRVFRGARMNNLPPELKALAMIAPDFVKGGYLLLDGHPTKLDLERGVGKRGNPVHLGNLYCDVACQSQRPERATWANAVIESTLKEMFPVFAGENKEG